MLEGNLTQGIEAELEKIAEIERAYAELRERGLDLYSVCGGYRMIALPDAERESIDGTRGTLHMNKSDWQKYSKLVKRKCVAREIARKNEILKRNMSVWDLARDGMEYAWRELDVIKEEGKRLEPLAHYGRKKLFSPEKIRQAMSGEAPAIDYDYVDLC